MHKNARTQMPSNSPFWHAAHGTQQFIPPASHTHPTTSTPPQAHPQDPDNFPFMTLGNKIDVDGGNARVVRAWQGC